MTENSKHLAECLAKALDAKKATDIQIIDVAGMTIVAECFVVASANNPIQVRALCQAVEEAVQTEFNLSPLRMDGYREGRIGLRRCASACVPSGRARLLQPGAPLERRKQYRSIQNLSRIKREPTEFRLAFSLQKTGESAAKMCGA